MSYSLNVNRIGSLKPNSPAWLAICSDIAAAKSGGRLGYESLLQYISKKNVDFFDRFPSIQIEDNASEANFPKTKTNNSAINIDWVCKLQETVCDEICNLRKQRVFPLIISGDHSSAIGIVAGINKAHPRDVIGIIYIDAHADFHSPFTSPSGNIHGMSLAAVCGLDHQELAKNNPDAEIIERWRRLKSLAPDSVRIKPEHIVFCAVRDCESEEISVMRKLNIKNFTVDEIRKNGAEQTAAEVLKILAGCDQLYISFDIDSLDSGIAPGTGTPVSNGLNPNEALTFCRSLIKEKKVCCFELTEVNPTRDRSNLTLSHASSLLEGVTEDLMRYY